MSVKHKALLLILIFCCFEITAQDSFSFAFITDVHLNKGGGNAYGGLEKALKSVRQQKAAFIITGGDNVDADDKPENRKDEVFTLYRDYKNFLTQTRLPYHVTIGNHDRFWAKENANKHLNNDGMFRQFFPKTYYSFQYKGWKFFILNSVQSFGNLYPVIDSTQQAWLREELQNTPKTQPIVISTHVPFLSVYYVILEGKYTDTDIVKNQHQVLKMFDGYNLKLVLQGHMHLYEEIKVKNIQFITGGAVSASWWGGSYHGTEEGYLLVNVKGNDFSWKYIDYGWEVKK